MDFSVSEYRAPAFDIAINGKTVTAVNDRLISLSLSDNRGFEADTLELTLDDSDHLLSLPARGTAIALSIGWRGETLTPKGVFIVDEIQHQGPPDQLVITSRSADFRDSFNVKREQSWKDIKVGKLVATLAARYDLKAAVSEDLADVEIDHADQTNESDISFLTRMAEMLGAMATIKNGMLLFMWPGKAVSASGKLLPIITITRASGDRHAFRMADRDAYTGVTAYWLDLDFGKTRPTKITRKVQTQEPSSARKNPASSSKEGSYLEGTEGNTFVMRTTFKTERAARRAAAAKWRQLQRGAAEFSITLAEGRADLFPGLHARVIGFKPQIDNADWIITQVTHTIDEHGFITGLTLEVKITDADMSPDGGDQYE